jgi:DNA-binding response OmpR family regulator
MSEQGPLATLCRKKILVIDDDDGVVELFQELLVPHYEVHVLSNGLEFPQLMMKFRPDLVILDVMMPWISGYDICHAIKSNPAWKHTPVLFTSSRKRPEDINLGLSRGADGYVTKPFSMQEIRLKIKSLLKEPDDDGAFRLV